MKKELHILNDYKRLKVFFSQTIALSSDEYVRIACIQSSIRTYFCTHSQSKCEYLLMNIPQERQYANVRASHTSIDLFEIEIQLEVSENYSPCRMLSNAQKCSINLQPVS